MGKYPFLFFYVYNRTHQNDYWQNMRYLTLSILLFITGLTKSYSQHEHIIHAGMIYNFAAHTKWPAGTSLTEFKIGVIGATPVESELKKLARSKTIKGVPMKIVHYNSASEVTGCNMVFVSKEKTAILPELYSKAESKHTMIISENKEASKQHFVFNFVYVAGRSRYQLNAMNAAKCGLKIEGSIINMAILIH